MRLVNFERGRGSHLGACLGDCNTGEIIDLRLAASWLHMDGQDTLPGSISDCLGQGQEALKMLGAIVETAQALSITEHHTWQEEHLLLPASSTRLLAPIARPGKVICVGMNYPVAGLAGLAGRSTRPDYPTLFIKPSSAVIGPNQAVRIPAAAREVAFEAELAVVMGRTTWEISENEALAYVGGYCLANDLGDRLLEKRTSQWTSGKLMDTFCPLGPALVTPDEVPDPGNLEIRTWLNDQLVQQGNTRDMFFGVPFLVHYLSQLTTLEPGDVILTGSPKRVGDQPAPVLSLQPGDHLTLQIEGLGVLENPII